MSSNCSSKSTETNYDHPTRFLHSMISKGCEEMVMHLIEAGANPEESSQEMETAILHTMMVSRYNIFQTLIKLGVSLECTFFFDNDCTPLMYAMERQTPVCFAKTLIDAGANINAVNYQGTVLDNFFEYGYAPWQEWTNQDELEILDGIIKAGHPITQDCIKKCKEHHLPLLKDALARTQVIQKE